MRKQKGLSVIAILVFLFLFLPLCLIVVTSFGTAAAIQFPIKGFTLDWYAKALQSETFMDSFKLLVDWGISDCFSINSRDSGFLCAGTLFRSRAQLY